MATLSDLHVGKPNWGAYGDQAITDLERDPRGADLLVLGGDIVDPSGDQPADERRLRETLGRIGRLAIPHKVAVIGNNDAECCDGPLAEYAERMEPWYREAGIHLLDANPVRVDDILFVGSFAYWSGELFQGGAFPHAEVNDWWHTGEFKHRHGSLDAFDLHRICMGRLRDHVRLEGDRVIVVTHTVPTGDLVRYGHSPKYDYLNTFMGFDGTRHPEVYDPARVILSLVGHTHRDERATLPNGIRVVNMSGGTQPRFLTV